MKIFYILVIFLESLWDFLVICPHFKPWSLQQIFLGKFFDPLVKPEFSLYSLPQNLLDKKVSLCQSFLSWFSCLFLIILSHVFFMFTWYLIHNFSRRFNSKVSKLCFNKHALHRPFLCYNPFPMDHENDGNKDQRRDGMR